MTPKRKKINALLRKHGISEDFPIEKEAESLILDGLSDPLLRRVAIDHEGFLYMEFNDENEQRTI